MGNFTKRIASGWGEWEDRSDRIPVTPENAHVPRPKGLVRCWKNRLYSVQLVRRNGFELLMVRRHDQRPIFPWKDLQRIKNELVGPERQAVQVFPRQSEVVDVANMAHLWVLPDGMECVFTFQNLERGIPPLSTTEEATA